MPQPKPRLVVVASSIQGVGVHTQDSVEPGTPLFAVRGVRHRTLDTNHRCDARLLQALDVMFRGATLGHPEIEFRPVAPAPGAPDGALGATCDHAARSHPELPNTTLARTAGRSRRRIARAMASTRRGARPRRTPLSE